VRILFIFFFQAEDGIRDFHVTGVQTCALPILSGKVIAGATVMESPVWMPIGSKFSMEQMMITFPLLSLKSSSSYSFQPKMLCSRSEERRVGKACSSRWGAEHDKEKTQAVCGRA